ncbi:MAG: hypothetical protein FWC64_03590 [Treponema sp.]|nr:hypothetical protein [Treponema sp.]
MSRIDSLAFKKAALDGILTEIALFNRVHPDFNCIVLENPAKQTGFCQKVSAIIDRAGTVIPLASECPLILFPITMDRELIARRLSATLNVRVLLSFEENNPENAVVRINSL